MRKIIFLSTILPSAILIILLFVFSSEKEKISDVNYQDAFRKNYKIFSPIIPESVDFAGENAPLNIFYIREKLDEEILRNTYFHSSTIGLIKRSNRWFPLIEPILSENNIPEDFKYLALIESGFENVVSPKGARGFWQFMEKTAREYGLEVNDAIDERYNVEKSTKAACKCLLDFYDEFKNWTLVAAAYNTGKRRIRESLEKQKVNNYYDLYLNEETSQYVFRILAIKTIIESPTRYGFYLREADLYPPVPTKKIKVTKTIPDLYEFASMHKINYRTLKMFNPWLRTDKLPDKSGRTYFIKIPKTGYFKYDKLDKQVKDYDRIFNDTLTVDELN
ncbi:MAG: lytic transglycosylase domain-containing protein [Bacteroidetes bacterium]|nr:lytic transglycosylase domain-containing protein [Bacteroidota bacterium]MBL7104958.1 lytic transglycosylase domain-containing protein [Bacteroidales bacterium]